MVNEEKVTIAKDEDTVLVEYSGSLADGTIFDSSVGHDPLEFTLGQGEVIPGFEVAVRGMHVEDTKTVTIPAAEAYGPYQEGQIIKIGRDELPPDLFPKVGEQLQMTPTGGGGPILVTVTTIDDTSITIDANSPLAGKDLTFELRLVQIK